MSEWNKISWRINHASCVDFGCFVIYFYVNLALLQIIEYPKKDRKGIFKGEDIIILIPREICENNNPVKIEYFHLL